MANEATEVSLATLADGAAGELFDLELAAVLKNIRDPNTPAKAKRVVTISLILVPGEDRESIAHLIDVKSKLAPVRPHAGTMYMGERGGRLVAVTFNPRQSDLFQQETPGITPLSTTREAAV